MPLRVILCLLCAVTVSASTFAQSPRFRWQTGQTLDYRVQQVTTVADTAGDKTETSVTKLDLTKRWQVQGVDTAGIATLQLSLLSLRMEMGKAGKEPVVFDSQKADADSATLNKDLLQYIGKPIATLRLDSQGRLIDVKESKFGPASRFVADLPFRVTLPDSPPVAGQAWERTYQIKMEPPQGAGESYNAVQRYICNSASPSELAIGVATTIKDQPESPADRIPLASLMPTGVVVFDVVLGRMKKAELKMELELSGHRGEGSSYHFSSTYQAELIAK